MADWSTIVLLSLKFRNMYELRAALAITQAKMFSFWKMRPNFDFPDFAPNSLQDTATKGSTPN